MNIPSLDQLKGNRSREICIKTKFPEFYNYIIENYTLVDNFQEKLYWFYNKLTEHPRCKQCGNYTTFISMSRGYHQFCSIRCSTNNKDVQNKSKQTNLNRYGNEISSRSDQVKQKAKQTCLEKYGVDNAAKAETSKQKTRETCLEKYGVENVFSSDIFQEKSRQTCLEKYGVEHYTSFGDKNIKDKIKKTKQNNFLLKHPDVISINNGILTCKCERNCENCDGLFDIDQSLYNSRCEFGGIMCTKLNSKNSNNSSQLELFVRNILDKYNVSYICKDRSVLNGKELDIYIPSKNIAIECNGDFWHNSLHMTKQYHYEKFVSCNNHNIQLLSFWGDQITNKPQIVKSIILSKLGIYKERIYARKCNIREVESKECSVFLKTNHLQGSVNSSVRIGLYYDNTLVSVMTFGKNRLCVNGNEQYELYRYCTKLNTQVIGGAKRLFTYFINKYKPTMISSFSSNDISNGSLYKLLGFHFVNNSFSYWYIHQKTNIRYHRFNFSKHKLLKEGADPNKTEAQIMFEKGYWKIYDSGQSKWIWGNRF